VLKKLGYILNTMPEHRVNTLKLSDISVLKEDAHTARALEIMAQFGFKERKKDLNQTYDLNNNRIMFS